MATALQKIKNYLFPTPDNPLSEVGAEWRSVEKVEKNLRGYITPVQLQRIRHDVSMWRDAVKEAEQAWYPHRVRMQRMYNDTILNGHVYACLKRRKDLTLLKDWCFKNDKEEESEEAKALLDKKWFAQFLEYALEAKFFGYSLIALGDIVEDQFKDITIIRRFNISPDRLNVTSYVYALSGAHFLEDPYVDWHVWVPTQTDVGISKIGYGLLYYVAVYEIICRNVIGWNADSAELYGMPIRKGRTSKTNEEERGEFEKALANMGSAGYILTDLMDEVELIDSKSSGQGYKIYESLEKRCESKISKIILGHADALDSTAGKLGNDSANSPAVQALNDTASVDAAFLEDIVNDTLIPKLKNLGMNFPEGFKFCFSNNQDLIEKRVQEDANNKATADLAVSMKNAGLEMDAKYFEERTGIPTKKIAIAPPVGFSNKIKNKLEKLYA
jgi:phage gp29-like protein